MPRHDFSSHWHVLTPLSHTRVFQDRRCFSLFVLQVGFDTRFDLRDIKNHYALVQQINKEFFGGFEVLKDPDADNNAIITPTVLADTEAGGSIPI